MLYVAALLAVLAPQTEGTLSIDGPLSARYQHVFNRNAVVDSRVAGEDLIALTPGGLLMKLTLPTLAADGVVYPEVPIVCLGDGANGDLLAADTNGVIYRVDVMTMTLTRVAGGPARPVAVGAYRARPGSSASIVVVTGDEVHDLGTGRSWKLDYLANRIQIHVDRSARLWIGSDNGEWGGWVARVDLVFGKLKVYPDCLTESDDRTREYAFEQFGCHGVRGFTELESGTMLVHGGTTHLGMSSAWVARLDDAVIVTVYENEEASWGEVRRTEKPRKPISHILEHPTTDTLYVVSFDEVFRADGGLSRFRLSYKLAPASNAAAAVAWMPDETSLLVSTPRDGVWRLANGESFPHAFTGDLGASSIDRIEPSNDGLVFYGEDFVWEQSAGDWSTKELVPPFEPRFDITELSGYAGWQTELAFVDSNGDIVSVSETNLSPGPRATVRFRGSSATLLAIEEEHEGYLTGGFATPDGELWATSRRGLYRLSDSGWVHAAALTMDGDAGAARVKALPTPGPPWHLLEQASGELFELSYEGGRTRLRSVVDKGVRLHDAVRFQGTWWFATSAGLRHYDFDKARWSSAGVSVDGARVLALDGAGRLWLGGSGLWVVVAGRVIDLSLLSPLAGVDVVAMVADPHRRHGVIVSLGKRGLVYVATE